jgi:hypothetical protein
MFALAMRGHLLAVLVTIAGLALAGCGASDWAGEENLPFPQDGAEVRAEALLNRFSDHLDGGDYRATCEDMVPVLQLRFAVRSNSCERAMRDVGQAGGLGHLEVESSHKTDRGLWVDTGEGKFLIRGNLIANIIPPGQ